MAEFRLRKIFKNNLFFFLFLIVICASYTCGGESQSVDSGSLPSDTLILNPSSGDFGSVTLGHSSTIVVNVSNSGPTTIDVLSMTISDPTNFSMDVGGGPNPMGSMTATIPSGEIRTFAVTFNPSSTGTFAADLDIEFGEQEIIAGTQAQDNSGRGRKVGWKKVGFSGKGVRDLVPNISIAPLNNDFGDVVMRDSSSPREIMLSNTGSAELHVSGIVLSDTTNFTLDVNVGSNACGSTSPTIPTGQNCTVSARFGPFSTGVFSSTLRVDSDDPDTPSLGVSLTGSGTASPPADKTITLAWDPPTTDVNGNPITDLVGYVLYYGPSPGNYDHSIDAGNGTTYSVTLSPGTWYFSARAYITPGFESDYSNELQVNI
jgi:hypothetical protein